MKKECALRLLLLDLGINAPELFKSFCFKIHYLIDNNPEKINDYIKNLKSDKDILTFFEKADSLFTITENWLDKAFFQMFKTEKIIYEYAEKLDKQFNSKGAKYMFILRNIIDDYEGLAQKRKLTKEEYKIMDNLLKNDDIYPQEKIAEIKKIYNAKNINELILCYYLSQNIGY